MIWLTAVVVLLVVTVGVTVALVDGPAILSSSVAVDDECAEVLRVGILLVYILSLAL